LFGSGVDIHGLPPSGGIAADDPGGDHVEVGCFFEIQRVAELHVFVFEGAEARFDEAQAAELFAGDFEFRFEFQLAPGANNGIALRSPNEGDPAYVGFECQVLDNTAEQYKGLERWQYHGSIYGIAAATATALKPVGEWNQETITMKGPKVKVELNGVVIIDIDLDKVAPDGKTVSGHKVDGLTRKTGHLGFCGHGDRVAFKNLRVKRL
jgi:hypothetical protein